MKPAYKLPDAVGKLVKRAARLAGIGLAASHLAACSFALPAFMGGEDPAETTGSLAAGPTPEARLAAGLGAEDWRRAKGALGLALDPQGNGRTVAWDNPETGLSGGVTPLASPYVEDDEICRRFTASVETSSGRVSRFVGRACRVSGDEWSLKAVTRAP